MRPIYLDYNATTPVDPTVMEAMIPFLSNHFGNPSSAHWFGIDAKDAIEKARDQIANLIGCSPVEIIFTGCATEANNLAIMGILLQYASDGGHIITSSIEHPAVLEVCRYATRLGFDLTILPVDSTGLVDPADIKSAIRSDTRLISVMHANNEVGTIQPVEEISRIAHESNVVFHSDAAQSIGKISIQVQSLGVDLMTIAGHKFYAPKGIGALYVRAGTRLQKILHGASHEHNLRPGTECVHNIVGLGAAAELAVKSLPRITEHLAFLRDRLYSLLVEHWPGVRLNGHPRWRLPNTLSIGFKGFHATELMNELPYLAVSAGAACHSPSDISISHVLEAMGVPLEYAQGTLRISTGRMTTDMEVETAAEMIIDALFTLSPPDNRQHHPDRSWR